VGARRPLSWFLIAGGAASLLAASSSFGGPCSEIDRLLREFRDLFSLGDFEKVMSTLKAPKILDSRGFPMDRVALAREPRHPGRKPAPHRFDLRSRIDRTGHALQPTALPGVRARHPQHPDHLGQPRRHQQGSLDFYVLENFRRDRRQDEAATISVYPRRIDPRKPDWQQNTDLDRRPYGFGVYAAATLPCIQWPSPTREYLSKLSIEEMIELFTRNPRPLRPGSVAAEGPGPRCLGARGKARYAGGGSRPAPGSCSGRFVRALMSGDPASGPSRDSRVTRAGSVTSFS
jgi:hypothetical protein